MTDTIPVRNPMDNRSITACVACGCQSVFTYIDKTPKLLAVYVKEKDKKTGAVEEVLVRWGVGKDGLNPGEYTRMTFPAFKDGTRIEVLFHECAACGKKWHDHFAASPAREPVFAE